MIDIRKADLGDCRGIAEVQVDSYRTAYAGLFPKSYLEHFTYEEQAQDWQELLAANTDDILLVAKSEERAVGYVLARVGRGVHPGYDAEIIALHVRQPLQRQGVGTALLRAASQEIQTRGGRSIMLWTLKGNPIRRWYESLDGRAIAEKRFQVDDWDIVEIAYGWEDITALAQLGAASPASELPPEISAIRHRQRCAHNSCYHRRSAYYDNRRSPPPPQPGVPGHRIFRHLGFHRSR